MIPGPKEPKHDMNSFLEPIVTELLELQDGVSITVSSATSQTDIPIRCLLLSVACDLPAARKVSGFLSYSARLGCSKCLKEFPGTAGNMDYSGFDRSTWPQRTNELHRQNIKRVLQACTKQNRTELESSLGCCCSSLLRLPYFDPITMVIIDSMHNLFLGTAKKMLEIWQDNGLLNKHHFEKIQNFVDSVNVPSDIGRIPHKISSGFANFTADQFKNWVNIYSVPALFNVLPLEHLECWCHFVLACRIICKPIVDNRDVILLDTLLLRSCQKVETLYGTKAITLNMHMHCHLAEIIKRYGPVHGFWLFSFERCNGILGNQPNNNKNIEPQIMKRLVNNQSIISINGPEQFSTDFFPLFDKHIRREVGSYAETFISNTLDTLRDKHLEYIQTVFCHLHSNVTNIPSPNSIYKKIFECYTT